MFGSLSELKIVQQVNQLEWKHTIDLGNGIITPGKWGPPNPLIKKALAGVDLRGKKVLDVGCWDGLWAFEAEKLGAREVYATDLISQRELNEQSTFMLAREVLGSAVQYFPALSVYDIRDLDVADFDVVLFFGVFYHLRHPVLAFTRLRQIMRTGALLLTEGEVIHNDVEAFARFYYRDIHFGDLSNWWIPTTACLREWIECCYFEITNQIIETTPVRTPLTQVKTDLKRLIGLPTDQITRCVITAEAVYRADDKYVYPDTELSSFHRSNSSGGSS